MLYLLRDAKEVKIEAAVAAIVSVPLAFALIKMNFFEAFYNQKRAHEDWQLYEILAICIAILSAGTALAVRHIFVLTALSRDLKEVHESAVDNAKTAVQNAKMAALGGLSGGMAHEISNALQPTLGLGELIQSGLEQDGKVDHLEYMRLILASTVHAQSIIENVLDFTREKSIDFVEYDALEVVSDTLGFGISMLQSMIIVEVSSPRLDDGEQLTLTCNKTSLMQVFVNILKNAAHAMDNQGDIRVSIEKAVMPEAPDQLALRISIQDSGAGMAPEVAQKVFEPFFTTKDISEGTGLGLSSVHGIIESHGGEISVTSTVGEGSDFVIYLPVTSSKATDC